MPINHISLLTGSLGFTLALAWNKAISDSVNEIIGNKVSSLFQAIMVSFVVIIIILMINLTTTLYSKYNNITLNNKVIKSGLDKNSKVKLWL